LHNHADANRHFVAREHPDDGSEAFASPHKHHFLSHRQHVNERRTWWVIMLTVSTMVLEIVSGLVFGSMSLLADGWHMASHASAMGITAMAYYLARKHKDNPEFTFGTGKVGDLAGYSSALMLLIIAVFMAFASIRRIIRPVDIHFAEAIGVAVVGLVVNLASASILYERSPHTHDDHGHHHHHHHDHNLRAAYFHVLADALTSILAIAALGLGMLWGWSFLDPVMGIVGALLISHWAAGLMRESGGVLLDRSGNHTMTRKIEASIKDVNGVRIVDFHLWRLGLGHYSAILSLESSNGLEPDFFKKRMRHIHGLSHLTIEVNASPVDPESKKPSRDSRLHA
jgi:cation diffusion facilitator family transporter